MKRFVALGMMLFCWCQSTAQQTPLVNQSIWFTNQTNIASAALESPIIVHGVYRKSWLSFPESPQLNQISLELAKKSNKAAWAGFIKNYSNSLYRSLEIKIGYRKTFKISSHSNIAFGMRVGWTQSSLNLNALKALSPEEITQYYLFKKTNYAPIDLGFCYTFKNLFVGVSSNNLYSYSSQANRNHSGQRNLADNSLQIAYKIIKNDWTVTLFLNEKSNHGLPVLSEFSCTSEFQEKYRAAVGVRSSASYFILVGLKLKSNFMFVYSYESSVSIKKISGNTHEIGIAFCHEKS